MSVMSIGVQVITPQTGTVTEARLQQQTVDREPVQPVEPTQTAPPQRGMGQNVDRQA